MFHAKSTDRLLGSSVARFGFEVLPSVLTENECHAIAAELADLFARRHRGVIDSNEMTTVGARNLQESWSDWRKIVCRTPVEKLLKRELGARYGLVRILFFDKPPGSTWCLSLHRDRTIAVAEHFVPPDPYGKTTTKAGVKHVVADNLLLQKMITLRVHLDAMHAGNGPLTVVPHSHRLDKEGGDVPQEVHLDAGDVFVMKPLLLHGSLSPQAGNADHRRVVHLEFAPRDALAEPYCWNRYDEVF